MARKKKEINKYEYKAILDRVVDGDTCDAMIDLGFNTWVKKRIRFLLIMARFANNIAVTN